MSKMAAILYLQWMVQLMSVKDWWYAVRVWLAMKWYFLGGIFLGCGHVWKYSDLKSERHCPVCGRREHYGVYDGWYKP